MSLQSIEDALGRHAKPLTILTVIVTIVLAWAVCRANNYSPPDTRTPEQVEAERERWRSEEVGVFVQRFWRDFYAQTRELNDLYLKEEIRRTNIEIQAKGEKKP